VVLTTQALTCAPARWTSDFGGRFNGLAEQCCADSPSDLLDGLLPLEQPNRGRRSSTRRSVAESLEELRSPVHGALELPARACLERSACFDLDDDYDRAAANKINAGCCGATGNGSFLSAPVRGTAGGMRCVHEGGVATSTAIMTWANTSQAMQSS
jgi:hypothetical protein